MPRARGAGTTWGVSVRATDSAAERTGIGGILWIAKGRGAGKDSPPCCVALRPESRRKQFQTVDGKDFARSDEGGTVPDAAAVAPQGRATNANGQDNDAVRGDVMPLRDVGDGPSGF